MKQKKLFEEIMAKIFPNLVEVITQKSKKLSAAAETSVSAGTATTPTCPENIGKVNFSTYNNLCQFTKQVKVGHSCFCSLLLDKTTQTEVTFVPRDLD